MPETVEDATAGLLNGVMILAIGMAFPVLVVWQVMAQWGVWTFEAGSDLITDALQVAGLSYLSFLFVRTGVRLIRKSVAWFRMRRPSSG
ncbi:hypothetical protein [Brevundimonas sp.]|uniref:hypothetical protein n=1 Tax=Brevundimonas sp. TaxID=1871086 RepID=UPI002ABC7C68|nr:hypothetical protein [Brevundimonas sp.]MDZ4361995.1 hypothetical protein [Brevundimonas sp.]